MKEEDDDQGTYEIKLFYNEKEFSLSINASYDETLGKISQILNLNVNSLILSYDDEDGDNILVSNEEDYSIFLEQVKTNLVKSLIIELNEKYIEEYSNLKINEINNIQFDDNEKDNQIGNNINNINEINNNDLFNDDDLRNSSIFKPKKNNNDDEQIEDKLYYFRCTNCDEYPILFVMFYCPECNLYLCENCGKNMSNHFHQLFKIDSQAKLYKIKEEENDKIEKNRKENEKEKKSNNIFSKLNPFKHFKDGRMKTIRKKNNKILGKSTNSDDDNNKLKK